MENKIYKNWKTICAVKDMTLRQLVLSCEDPNELAELATVYPELFTSNSKSDPTYPLSMVRRTTSRLYEGAREVVQRKAGPEYYLHNGCRELGIPIPYSWYSEEYHRRSSRYSEMHLLEHPIHVAERPCCIPPEVLSQLVGQVALGGQMRVKYRGDEFLVVMIDLNLWTGIGKTITKLDTELGSRLALSPICFFDLER